MNLKNNVVIILNNWNGWLDTIECLESIFQMSIIIMMLLL